MQPGDKIAGRFRLQEIAGRGGMGLVWKAFDESLKVTVALKTILSPNQQTAQRFLREAELLASLPHPRIVKHIQHGLTKDETLYLAMEWLEGEDLSKRLRRGPLSIEEATSVVSQVASALEAAHSLGVIHRDIKPQNIFLVGNGEWGTGNGEKERKTPEAIPQVKVLDFGIARPGSGWIEMTHTGAILGTPGYLAPEQATKGAKGLLPSADIFSLGCVFFECLTGQKAFIGEHVMAVLSKILLEDVPDAASLRPEIPPTLSQLVARMLSKDPSLRPQHGGELLAALSALTRREAAPVARGLTRHERRYVSILLLPDAAETTSASGETLAMGTSPHAELEALSARFEARLDLLLDGSALLSFIGEEDPVGLSLRVARCALGLRALRPMAHCAAALGLGDLSRSVPVGEVIDRAARLLHDPSHAGGIPVDSALARFLQERFQLLEHDGRFELTNLRTLQEPSRTLLGRQTSFVGRERELSLLESAYTQCEEESVSKVVLITAPAGAGKSRLRAEIVARLLPRGPELLFAQGDPMQAGSPLGLLRSLVQRACGLLDGEPIEAQRQKLSTRISKFVPEEDRARVVEFLGEMLDVPFPDERSPQLRAARQDAMLLSDQLSRAFIDWLRAECDAGPVVLILDDLQWGDPSTVSFLDAALGALPERPLFVLALARPEVRTLFPSLWATRNLEELRLSALSKRACERLLSQTLGEKLSTEQREELIRRSEGNAFYLEELIRAVHQGETHLPETLLAAASARLMTISTKARRTLRAASIFGETAWEEGIGVLLEEPQIGSCLEELRRQEILTQQATSRFPAQREYRFRHSLLREAAYSSLTEEDRRLGHRLAGAWLEEQGAKDAATLAEHFERGGEPERAARWYREAASQALESNDLAGALKNTERGLSLSTVVRERGLLFLVQAETYNWLGDFQKAEKSGEAALAALTGEREWFKAAAELSLAYGRRGQIQGLVSLTEQLLQVPSLQEPAHLVALSRIVARLTRGNQIELGGRVLEWLKGQPLPDLDLWSAAWLYQMRAQEALSVGDKGEWARGLLQISEAFISLGDRRNACASLSDAGFAFLSLGCFEEAERLLQKARVDAQRLGLGRVLTLLELSQVAIFFTRGEWEETIQTTQKLLPSLLAQRDLLFAGGAAQFYARALGAQGKFEEALSVLSPLHQDPSLPLSARLHVLAALSEISFRRGALPEALSWVRELQKYPPTREILYFFPYAFVIQVEVLRANQLQEEAASLQAQTRQLILEASLKISDKEYRRSFLENIPEHVYFLRDSAAPE